MATPAPNASVYEVDRTSERGQQLVLDGVTWPHYVRLLRLFDDRHLRITYDKGTLEITTLSPEHERYKHLLGLMISALVEEQGLDMAGFGSMTFKSSKQQRGLEPDECYWIQSEPAVRGKDRVDLRRDPPPDLVIEIDITHSSLDRLSIYASLGVREIWRFDGARLRFHVLSAEGSYTDSERSHAFPWLEPTQVEQFIEQRGALSETELLRRFRRWARERGSEVS